MQKSTHTNNYIKCKWTRCPFQKTEIAKLDKIAGLNYVLPSVDTLIFIDIKTFKIKGQKKDILCKKPGPKRAGVASGYINISQIDFKKTHIYRNKKKEVT